MSHPNPQAEYGENEIGTPMRITDKQDHSSITSKEKKEWAALDVGQASERIKELITDVREYDEEMSGIGAIAFGNPEWYKDI